MNNIKLLRKEKGLTQTDMARMLGITQNNFSYWENGKVKIDNESLEKMANFFNVSIDFLLGRTQNRNEEEYTILGRGGGRIKITKEQQEVINTLLDSFTKDKKE